MKCESCNAEMNWVGSIREGGMVCPFCSKEPPPTPFNPEDEGTWPDDLRFRPFIGWEVRCCCCNEWFDLYCDITEYVPGDQYCGGSPRCCP